MNDGKKRVLVVDDSSVTAKQLKLVIEELSGYTVVGHAKDGVEALRMYKELAPDVVCMDIVMPRMDGLEAMRSLLKMDEKVKVVMISSLGGSRDKVIEALRLGAKTIIAKPFEPSQVRNALDSV